VADGPWTFIPFRDGQNDTKGWMGPEFTSEGSSDDKALATRSSIIEDCGFEKTALIGPRTTAGASAGITWTNRQEGERHDPLDLLWGRAFPAGLKIEPPRSTPIDTLRRVASPSRASGA